MVLVFGAKEDYASGVRVRVGVDGVERFEVDEGAVFGVLLEAANRLEAAVNVVYVDISFLVD